MVGAAGTGKEFLSVGKIKVERRKMNTDIRIDCNFRTNPKTKKLKRRGGLEMVDCLIALWIWSAQNRPCGNLSGLDEEDIELAADWNGEQGVFYRTLVDLGWLDESESGCELHDWHEHQPWVAQGEERSNKARLSRLARKNPDKYKELAEKGITGVTKDEFYCYTTAQRPYNDQYKKTAFFSTPAPAPAPVPAPTPAPTHIVDKKILKQNFDPVGFRPDYIPEQLWLSFLENRKFKKLQNSELALTTACNQFLEAVNRGHDIGVCVGAFVEGKWTRFKAEWMDNLQGQQRRGGSANKPMSTKERNALELLGKLP